MLENYILDAHTRYESHRLIYTSAQETPIELAGMLGAAVLAVAQRTPQTRLYGAQQRLAVPARHLMPHCCFRR